jgi:hypothetical protein
VSTITPRLHHTIRQFDPEAGSSESWIRVFDGSVWKFIVHRNLEDRTVNVAAVKMVDGRGVESKNFRL